MAKVEVDQGDRELLVHPTNMEPQLHASPWRPHRGPVRSPENAAEENVGAKGEKKAQDHSAFRPASRIEVQDDVLIPPNVLHPNPSSRLA